MLSILYYLFIVLFCTLFMALSAIAWLLTAWWDKRRCVIHFLSRVLVRIFFFMPPCWRFRIEGLDRIDRRKPYVITINHQAMTDIPALYFLPLNFRWVSKREVFRIPFFGQFLLLHGDICIDRSRSAEAMEKLVADGRRWIDRGVSVAIFPEGTRSRDGQLHRFKGGAFLLAHQTRVAILPVVVEGTTRLFKSNRLFNWCNKVTVRVLEPIDAERVAATDPKEMAVEVHQRMAQALDAMRRSDKE